MIDITFQYFNILCYGKKIFPLFGEVITIFYSDLQISGVKCNGFLKTFICFPSFIVLILFQGLLYIKRSTISVCTITICNCYNQDGKEGKFFHIDLGFSGFQSSFTETAPIFLLKMRFFAVISKLFLLMGVSLE